MLVGIPEWKKPLGRYRHRWKDKLERILAKQGGQLWIGFIWLRIGTSCGLL
jgi:hypothetical protein